MTAQLHLFKGRRARATSPSEFALQCAVADVLRRWAQPGWLWTHIGHGELRPTSAAVRLKRAGVQPGWPDLVLLPPKGNCIARAHFIELKRVGGLLSEHQAGFALWCQLNGYPHEVVHSIGQAIELLKKWGAVRTGIHLQ